MALTNSTVSGGIYAGSSDPTPFVGVVSIKAAASLIDGECKVGNGVVTWTSNGYNIESPGNTCGFDQSTDMSGVSANDLNLGELADNGGPTMTHALQTIPVVSVAIDQIPAVDCEVDKDQRGQPRPGGTMCDVGAFEVQP
jgi:hypothetical protein